MISADGNLDGRINAVDLSLTRRNQAASQPVYSLSVVACGLAVTASSSEDKSLSWGGVYDRVAGVTPAAGYETNAAMQFFESEGGWVQPLASMSAPEGGVWTVPGEEGAEGVVIVDWFYREAGYGNDLSLYTVDDNAGKIGVLSPGDTGYAAAAAGRVQGTLNSLDWESIANPNHQYDVPAASPLVVTLEAGTKFAFFLTQGRYTNTQGYYYKWFPFSSANVDGYQHFQQITTGDSGG